LGDKFKRNMDKSPMPPADQHVGLARHPGMNGALGQT
jgi:hypothetical protein